MTLVRVCDQFTVSSSESSDPFFDSCFSNRCRRLANEKSSLTVSSWPFSSSVISKNEDLKCWLDHDSLFPLSLEWEPSIGHTFQFHLKKRISNPLVTRLNTWTTSIPTFCESFPFHFVFPLLSCAQPELIGSSKSIPLRSSKRSWDGLSFR